MNKKNNAKILFAFLVILCTSPVYPMGITTGVMLWYAQWSPHWEDEYTDIFADEDNEKSHFKINNAYMGGPVVSLKVGDKTILSGNFIYGKYQASCFKMWYEGEARIIESRMDIQKYDTEVTLSYSLFPKVQVFIGGKYQHYDLESHEKGLYQISDTSYSRTLRSNSYGPGLGLGLNLPIYNNFHFIWNVSAVMLFAEIHDKWHIPGEDSPSHKYTLHAYGGNTNILFAYLLDDAGITILTGIRYQYLVYKQQNISSKGYDSSQEFTFPRNYNNKSDTFAGISLAALYNFDI